MTSCPDVTEWILYAADEVSAPRREELARHLSACDACRRELDRLQRGFEALETLEAPPPLRAEALHTLRRRLAAEGQRRSRQHRRLRALRWFGAAAAAAAVVAVAVFLPPEPQQPTWPDREQVDAEITEIAATLELLESDTAWDLEPLDEPASRETPAGQSRSGPRDARTRHG